MPIRRHILVLGLLASAASAASAQVATYPLGTFAAAPVPVMLRSDPLTLPVDNDDLFALADLGTDLATLELRDQPGISRGLSPSAARSRLQATAKTGEARPAGDDEDALPLPGQLKRSPVKIPSRFLKDQGVASHTPDVSFDLDKRTTVGLFGEMSRTSRTDVEANLAKPDREVGAGFTLQYKFGTH